MKPTPSQTKPPRGEPPPAAPVSHARRTLAIPHLTPLRELRRAFALGGLPPRDKRTPEEDARIAGFRATEELCRFLDEFRRRIESGERCQIVESPHKSKAGRLLIELTIEEAP